MTPNQVISRLVHLPPLLLITAAFTPKAPIVIACGITVEWAVVSLDGYPVVISLLTLLCNMSLGPYTKHRWQSLTQWFGNSCWIFPSWPHSKQWIILGRSSSWGVERAATCCVSAEICCFNCCISLDWVWMMAACSCSPITISRLSIPMLIQGSLSLLLIVIVYSCCSRRQVPSPPKLVHYELFHCTRIKIGIVCSNDFFKSQRKTVIASPGFNFRWWNSRQTNGSNFISNTKFFNSCISWEWVCMMAACYFIVFLLFFTQL